MAHQQAVHHACLMLFPAGFLGCSYDLVCNDGTVGSCNFELFHLARNDLLNLIFQAECHFRDIGRGDGGFDQVVPVGGKN